MPPAFRVEVMISDGRVRLVPLERLDLSPGEARDLADELSDAAERIDRAAAYAASRARLSIVVADRKEEREK